MSNLGISDQNELNQYNYSDFDIEKISSDLSDYSYSLEWLLSFSEELIDKLKILTSESSEEIKEVIEQIKEACVEAHVYSASIDGAAYDLQNIVESVELETTLVN